MRIPAIETSSSVPLWSQIEEGMRGLVAAGSLPPGDGVLSVRDMARELRVNPATVSKAYRRLVEQGVLEVRRGDGTYVAQDPPKRSQAERRRLLGEAATRFAAAVAAAGGSDGEALAVVETALSDIRAAKEGGR